MPKLSWVFQSVTWSSHCQIPRTSQEFSLTTAQAPGYFLTAKSINTFDILVLCHKCGGRMWIFCHKGDSKVFAMNQETELFIRCCFVEVPTDRECMYPIVDVILRTSWLICRVSITWTFARAICYWIYEHQYLSDIVCTARQLTVGGTSMVLEATSLRAIVGQ